MYSYIPPNKISAFFNLKNAEEFTDIYYDKNNHNSSREITHRKRINNITGNIKYQRFNIKHKTELNKWYFKETDILLSFTFQRFYLKNGDKGVYLDKIISNNINYFVLNKPFRKYSKPMFSKFGFMIQIYNKTFKNFCLNQESEINNEVNLLLDKCDNSFYKDYIFMVSHFIECYQSCINSSFSNEESFEITLEYKKDLVEDSHIFFRHANDIF